MQEVVVVDNICTGLAKSFRGSFNLTRSDDMVAHVMDALLERNPKVSPVASMNARQKGSEYEKNPRFAALRCGHCDPDYHGVQP